MDDVTVQNDAAGQNAINNDQSMATPKNDNNSDKKGDLTVALRLEREKRRAIEEQLQEIREAQQKAEEARLAEQGKYQELYEKSNSELEELRASKTTLAEKLETYEKRLQDGINAKMESLSDEDKAIAKMAIDGRPLDKQEEILNGLLAKFSPKQTSVNKFPDGNAKANTSKDSNIAALYKDAKKSGNIAQAQYYRDILRVKGLEIPTID